MMNDIQIKIAELQANKWTISALAEALGQARVTVDKWKSGERYPANHKAVIALLDEIGKRKRIPKQKRYTTTERVYTSNTP